MDKVYISPPSLSGALIRRVGVLSIIGMIGLGGVIILSLLLTMQWVKSDLNQTKIEAANAFDLFFLDIQSDLQATSEGLASHKDISEALLALRIRNNVFLNVLFIDPEGVILAQRSATGHPALTNNIHPEWIQSPPSLGEIVIGSVGFEGKFPYVDMAVTVTDDISLSAGLLLVRVDLTNLWNATLDIRVGETGYVYVVDDTGQLVAFHNWRFLESGSNLHSLVGHSPQEIAAALSFYKGMNEQVVLAVAQPLKVVPWFAIVEQSAREVLALFMLIGTILLFAIAVVALLLYNTLHFTNGRIVNPLLTLRAAVAEMEKGHLEHPVDVQYYDELGQLGIAFNQMAAKLQSQTDALRQSESLYRLMAENTVDVIWVMDVTTRRFKYVSPSIVKLRGYQPEEVMAQSINELFSPESAQKVDEWFTTRVHQLPAGASPERHFVDEVDQPCKDGSIVHTEITTTYLLNEQGQWEIVGVSRDITERKQAEQNLRFERDRAQRYLDTVETIIVALNSEGNIEVINRKGCQLLGYTEDELLGENWFSTCLPQPEGIDAVFPVFTKLLTGDKDLLVEYFENPIVTRYGELKQIAWHNALLYDGEGHIIGTLSSGEDITERKQAEILLTNQLDELRRWHQTTLKRETRILDLKHEVNALLVKTGEHPRYLSAEGE